MILRERDKVLLKNGKIGFLYDAGNDYRVDWAITEKIYDYNSVIQRYIKEKDIEQVLEPFDWHKELNYK